MICASSRPLAQEGKGAVIESLLMQYTRFLEAEARSPSAGCLAGKPERLRARGQAGQLAGWAGDGRTGWQGWQARRWGGAGPQDDWVLVARSDAPAASSLAQPIWCNVTGCGVERWDPEVGCQRRQNPEGVGARREVRASAGSPELTVKWAGAGVAQGGAGRCICEGGGLPVRAPASRRGAASACVSRAPAPAHARARLSGARVGRATGEPGARSAPLSTRAQVPSFGPAPSDKAPLPTSAFPWSLALDPSSPLRPLCPTPPHRPQNPRPAARPSRSLPPAWHLPRPASSLPKDKAIHARLGWLFSDPVSLV